MAPESYKLRATKSPKKKGLRRHVLPLIDQHFLFVAALAERVAQIVYFIPFLKVLHVWSDTQDNASPVITHDMEMWLILSQRLDTLVVVGRIIIHAPADLDVYRVDGRPFDADEHLSPGRRRRLGEESGFEVLE